MDGSLYNMVTYSSSHLFWFDTACAGGSPPVTDNSSFSLFGLIRCVSMVVMVIILLQKSSIFSVVILWLMFLCPFPSHLLASYTSIFFIFSHFDGCYFFSRATLSWSSSLFPVSFPLFRDLCDLFFVRFCCWRYDISFIHVCLCKISGVFFCFPFSPYIVCIQSWTDKTVHW